MEVNRDVTSLPGEDDDLPNRLAPVSWVRPEGEKSKMDSVIEGA